MTLKKDVSSMAAFYREYESKNPTKSLVSYRQFTKKAQDNPNAKLEDIILTEDKATTGKAPTKKTSTLKKKDDKFIKKVEEEENELKVGNTKVRKPRGA